MRDKIKIAAVQMEPRIMEVRENLDKIIVKTRTAADSGAAEALGVFKEVDDSRGGSGFSFADLAADRAGIRFAELATLTPLDAKQHQKRVSQVKSETEFMPRVDNLPEGIMALKLKQEYGNLGSHSYLMINAEIDRRIAACWIYN